MEKSRFIIGIDLGTTNCAMSYIDTSAGEAENNILLLDIPQIFSPGEVGKDNLLPSFIYLPTEEEKKSNSFVLSWDPFGERVIGHYARKRGAEVEGRLIFSAKSWLCHLSVDRTSSFLPVDSEEEDIQKLSPVVAQASFLRHLKAAWNYKIGKDTGLKMEDQEIYLTIPASFDAFARELTLRAAKSAGFENITLLEEPQAAFYAFLHNNKDNWKDFVKVDDLILVCDVGGGTCDFSLIYVTEKDGELSLERKAVGEHLLLGGDNMDLALSYYILESLKHEGKNLSSKQFQGLINSVRISKEKILSGAMSDDIIITGAGRGLVAGSMKFTLTRDIVQHLIIDAFFPLCGIDDMPESSVTEGLTELTLLYCQDSAVTKHIAGFLRGQQPTAVLFNGGVFHSIEFKHRVLQTLYNWYGDANIREIAVQDLSTSVSKGAGYFGLVQRGEGLKIKGGIGRSYYIEIASPRPVVPGMPRKTRALCLVPLGAEEETRAVLDKRSFGLVVGQPVNFRLLSTTLRPEDKTGELVDDWEDSIQPVSTIHTTVENPAFEKGATIPVMLSANVTSIGTLEIYLFNQEKDLKEELKFNIRGDD